MATVDAEDEQMWRFMFDKDGVVTIPNAIAPEHLEALNRELDAHMAAEMPADARTMRFPVTDGAPSGQGDAKVSLLDWGKCYRDILDNPRISPILAAICGDRFRLDHIYLDVIKPPLPGEETQLGPINAGLHGAGGAFNVVSYYTFDRGEMHNGLSVAAYNLAPVGPDDGGFACVPGTHKSNYAFPDHLRDMDAVGVHESVRRCGGPPGSCIIFTEALTHGTLPWRGAGERRTLFVKFSPHAIAWSGADGFWSADDHPWSDELTLRQRQILEPPSAPESRSLQRFREQQAVDEQKAKL